MMTAAMRSLGCRTVAAALSLAGSPALAADSGEKIDFARDVRPIFARACFHCHGPKEEEGGLRLDDRTRVLAGGVSGPAIVPGDAAQSLVYQFITGQNEDKIIMPPKDRGQRLSPAECELVRRWIDAGAPWSENTASAIEMFAPPMPSARSDCFCTPPRAATKMCRSARAGGRPRLVAKRDGRVH